MSSKRYRQHDGVRSFGDPVDELVPLLAVQPHQIAAASKPERHTSKLMRRGSKDQPGERINELLSKQAPR